MKGRWVVASLLVGVLIAGCLGSSDENKKPKSSIIADRTNIYQGEIVHFNGNGSFDLDGKIMEYKWDFNDGSFDNNVICNHKFTNDGNFNVTLTVRDDKGSYGSSVILIMVKKVVNSIPIAIGNIKLVQPTIYQGDSVQFDASDSYDNDGIIQKYSWDLGTGLIYDDMIINFVYDVPGTYLINLSVEDNNRTKGYDLFEIVVEPAIEITILEHEHRNGIFVDEYYWIKIQFDNFGGKELDLSDSSITYFWITTVSDQYEGYISSGDDNVPPYSNEQKGLDFDYFPSDLTPTKLIFKYNEYYKYEVYIS